MYVFTAGRNRDFGAFLQGRATRTGLGLLHRRCSAKWMSREVGARHGHQPQSASLLQQNTGGGFIFLQFALIRQEDILWLLVLQLCRETEYIFVGKFWGFH